MCIKFDTVGFIRLSRGRNVSAVGSAQFCWREAEETAGNTGTTPHHTPGMKPSIVSQNTDVKGGYQKRTWQ